MLAEVPDVWAGGARPAARARAAARPGVRQPAVAGGPRRLAGVARAAARLRREGDARGRRPHHVDRRPTRPTRRPCTPPSTRRSTTRRCAAVLDGLLDRVAGPGWSNALAAKLLALTMPGVPDVYQGSELWEQSLVDPDNRRPVDFDVRRQVLAGCSPASDPCSPRRRRPGHAKLLVTAGRADACAATSRSCSRRTPRCAPRGAAADHVLAFDRGGAVTVATRLPVGLAAAAAGATPCCRCPTGAWARPARPAASTPATAPLHELLADLPGRAAGPGGRDELRTTTGPFDVWAPRADAAPAVGGRCHRRDGRAATATGGSPDGAVAGPDGRTTRLRLPARRRRTRPDPTRGRAASRRASTQRSRTFDPDRVRLDRPAPGPGGSCRGR